MRVKSHKRNSELAKRRRTRQSRSKMNKTMFPLVANLVGLKTGNLSIAVMHATTVTPSPGSAIVFSVNISSICCILLKKLTFTEKQVGNLQGIVWLGCKSCHHARQSS